MLSEEQKDHSIRFASRLDDKFAGVDLHTGPNGTPLLDGALSALECSVHEVMEGGDHVILVGKVEHLAYEPGGQPLVYFRGNYSRLGE